MAFSTEDILQEFVEAANYVNRDTAEALHETKRQNVLWYHRKKWAEWLLRPGNYRKHILYNRAYNSRPETLARNRARNASRRLQERLLNPPRPRDLTSWLKAGTEARRARRRLSESAVLQVLAARSKGHTYQSIATHNNLHYSSIVRICYGLAYKDVYQKWSQSQTALTA